MGSGMNETVNALATYGDKLAVGGQFTTAGGKVSAYIARWTKQISSDVGDWEQSVPRRYGLGPCYPNPFNSATIIEYAIPRGRSVSMTVCDVAGRRVRTLVDERKPGGSFRVVWDGTDESGRPVASGVYFCRLAAGEIVESRKLVLLK
jgi:hypothetical protein